MEIFSGMAVWRRLAMLVVIALLGMAALAGVMYNQFVTLEREAKSVSRFVPAVRYTQRVIVRALDTRSQLMLALQHNPASPEIVKLHDHAVAAHIDGARKAMGELRESMQLIGDAAPELREALGGTFADMEGAIADFARMGVEPVIRQFEIGNFDEANVLLLKQTNPTYNKLKAVASGLADAIAKLGQARTQVLNDHLDAAQVLIGISLLVILSACVAMGVLVTRSITHQIGGEPGEGMQIMERVSRGDLTGTMNTVAGSMLDSASCMISSLRAMLSNILGNSRVLRNSASSIKAAIREIADSSHTQAGATSSVAAAIEELTVSINHIADSVKETDADAERSAQEALQGQCYANQVADSMGVIARQLSSVNEQIKLLDSRSQDISSIASVIKDIADQTNLLALNAAIEAARAGESGRGFAVVADEVRKLAERTAKATGEIEQMIASFQHETQSAVAVMETAMPQVEESTGLVELSREALDRIHANAQAICSRVRGVADATHEQSAASTAIAQEVERIAQSAEESSAAAHQTMQAVEDVENQAVQLEVEVSKFKV